MTYDEGRRRSVSGRNISFNGNGNTRRSGRYLIDNRADSQQPNTTPGLEISFDPGQFITSTAMRTRPTGRDEGDRARFSPRRVDRGRSTGIHRRRRKNSPQTFRQTPRSFSDRERSVSTRSKISSDRGPRVPSQPSLSDSIVIDCAGDSMVDDVAYTPVACTLWPKLPHRTVISATSAVNDTSSGRNAMRSHDRKSNNRRSSADGRDAKPPKSDTIEEELATLVDCVRSGEFDHCPSTSDIPCGQGDNTNTPPACGLDFASFFSQVPASLPSRIVNMSPVGATTNNGDRAAVEAKLEPCQDEAELTSMLTVLSPRQHLNNPFFAQDVVGSSTTGRETVTGSRHLPPFVADPNSTEAKLLDNVMNLKDAVQDSIPSSLKPNFNSSRRLANSASTKQSPPAMPPCPMNVTRPLPIRLSSQTADQSQRDADNPFLNVTKPLDLCSQATCNSLFNDLRSNPTQNLTLMYTGEMPVPAENPGPPPAARDGGSQGIDVPQTIPADKSPNAPTVIPFPNDHFNDASEPTVNIANISSLTQPAITPGLHALLCQRCGLRSHREPYCPTLTNLVQPACDWQSFQEEVYCIASEIHTLLRHKLSQLNGSNADALVCDLQLVELQSDACMRNQKYSFRLENRKKFTMECINDTNQVSPPSKPSQAPTIGQDFVRTPEDAEEFVSKEKVIISEKRKEKLSCDRNSTCDDSIKKRKTKRVVPIPETPTDSSSTSNIPHKSKKRKKSTSIVDVDDFYCANGPQRGEETGKKAKQKRTKPDPLPEPVVETKEKRKKSRRIIGYDAPSPTPLPGKSKKKRKSESYSDEIVNQESANDSCDSRTKDNTVENLRNLKKYRKLVRSEIKKDYYSSQENTRKQKETTSDLISDTQSHRKKSKKSSKKMKYRPPDEDNADLVEPVEERGFVPETMTVCYKKSGSSMHKIKKHTFFI